MTDRELLEAAAKAAGLGEYSAWSDCIKDYDSDHRWGPALHRPDFEVYSWNPLTNDGDALRLVVTLGMNLGVYLPTHREAGRSYVHTKQLLGYSSDGFASYQDGAYTKEEHGQDSLAATRRAITRAAAAMLAQR